MKGTLIALSLLVLAVSVVVPAAVAAEHPAAAAAPAVDGSPAAPNLSFLAPTIKLPSCSDGKPTLLRPAPSERSASCGLCSDTGCQGAPFNTSCGYSGGHYYYCNIVYGGKCTEGGWDCTCWTGPIP